MDCAGCGGVWFVEEKQVIATSPPEQLSHLAPLTLRPLPTSRARYVYRCAHCGLAYGTHGVKRETQPAELAKPAASPEAGSASRRKGKR